jgi:uncharacterized membrane protein
MAEMARRIAAQAAAGDTSVFGLPMAELSFADPINWVRAGWNDFKRAPGIGIFYGGCFVIMGWMLMGVFKYAPAYTLALSAGFLLMGPLMCLGLYYASACLERGEQPNIFTSLVAWRTCLNTVMIFGGVLLILEMLWGRASLIVFALSFDGIPDFKGSLMALLDPQNVSFIVAYLAVGSVFAGLIFSVSVIAMPMILDRDVDAVTAALMSMRLVLTQMGVMVWWGVLIAVIIGLAMLPGFLGLFVAGPVIGHASWHAYRAVLAPPTQSVIV